MARPKRIFTEKEKKLIVALYQEGKIDQEIADLLSMSRTTFLYALKSNRLVDTIKKVKEIPNKKVERALFKRAIGYQYIERKRERIKERFKSFLKRTVTIKEVPPDVTACIYWLGNRNSKRWRNKQEIEHTGEAFRPIIVVSTGKVEDKLGQRLGETKDRA